MDTLAQISQLLSTNLNLKAEDIETIVDMIKVGMSPESIAKILEEIQTEAYKYKYQ